MWSLLRSDYGQQQKQQNPDAFYDVVFGGSARLQRLKSCLAALKTKGASLVILSNGIESELEEALRHVQLRDAFSAVLGGESQMRYAPETTSSFSPRSSKPEVLAKLAVGAVEGVAAGCAHIVFIDDDMDNYPSSSAATPEERQTWRLAERRQDPPADAPLLVAWPVLPAAGLGVESMARLEALLGASSGQRTAPAPPSET